jgi:hypothetical protein
MAVILILMTDHGQRDINRAVFSSGARCDARNRQTRGSTWMRALYDGVSRHVAVEGTSE